MKNYLLLIALFIGLNSNGQDVFKDFNASSISITEGANIVYPSISKYSTVSFTPSSTITSWSSLSYEHALYCAKHFTLGAQLGIGCSKYKYSGSQNSDGRYDAPDFSQEEKNFEMNGGISATVSFWKLGWFNEMSVCKDIQTSSVQTGMELPAQQSILNENMGRNNLTMFYQTGISVKLCEYFTLTPFVAIPFINFTNHTNWFSQQYNNDSPYIYNNVRLGLMLTCRFCKA